MRNRTDGVFVVRVLLLALLAVGCLPFRASAQIGEYRTDFAIGFNGGYMLSNVAFSPSIPQGMLGGITGGFTARYTCEKYFKSICSLVAEVNYAETGWKENILTMKDEPVPLQSDPTQSLQYSRKATYVQIPLLARLGWGRERNGFQFFFQIGPQFGFYLNDKVDTNFDIHLPEFDPKSSHYQYADLRSSHVVTQDTLAIENKFDYGITGGIGLEFSNRHVGHFLIEGRYYYGLGNIFGATKRDYFGRSNYNSIVIKMTYLFDIIRTKNSKIK